LIILDELWNLGIGSKIQVQDTRSRNRRIDMGIANSSRGEIGKARRGLRIDVCVEVL
jgi:hypothetical protein